MNEAIEAEFEHLRLHDRSATGLLRDGSTKATCTVRSGQISWTTTLPRTGAVHGSGNHPPAAVMSTYLSHKPATKIYKSVFEPTPGEEDDFAWLADNMSSAAEYLAWHQQASAVQADLAQARLRFGPCRPSRECERPIRTTCTTAFRSGSSKESAGVIDRSGH